MSIKCKALVSQIEGNIVLFIRIHLFFFKLSFVNKKKYFNKFEGKEWRNEY